MEKLREATDKTNLMRLAGQEELATLRFMKLKNGVPTPYLLQKIKSRESDTHHIVLGVRKETGGKA